MLEILLGILLLLLCIFIYQGIKTLGLSSREITREIAKAQLATYKNIVATKPNLQGEKLYRAILGCRMTYDDWKINNVLVFAESLIDKKSKAKINFRYVVWAMAILEYIEMRTRPLSMSDEVEMMREVIKIIPEGI